MLRICNEILTLSATVLFNPAVSTKKIIGLLATLGNLHHPEVIDEARSVCLKMLNSNFHLEVLVYNLAAQHSSMHIISGYLIVGAAPYCPSALRNVVSSGRHLMTTKTTHR